MSSNLTRNFTVAEMACRCCGVCLMRDSFMAKLQVFRDAFGLPVRVISGYRCKHHNKKVSPKAPHSYHTRGMAADLQLPAPLFDRDAFLALARGHFTNVVVISPTSVHVDEGPKRNWEYK